MNDPQGAITLFRHFHESKFSKTRQQRISSQTIPTKEGVRKSLHKAILDKHYQIMVIFLLSESDEGAITVLNLGYLGILGRRFSKRN
ncbi:MAG: hypothetical protein EAZ90_11450 [Oscillatoriales cyanobacterium]|jgi:hypothetical protein|nr:MAG: hypothetical protein EAZ94_02900 [Oscillatoriales cyanobacterium]TAE25912.1 MAG: hypothetical protein EAZ93_09365 [Oscillatoriales cyanobacterium]TAE43273.1 MAG: hypothetical protein EAZ90_11450 [Oscillatoriales cyanobacterium]TAE53769.1 MAG: hypothetical protein EAZ88_10965 [Oscillatoriales cyanobacterium]TAE70527.1 MAG: hypothetical protein EAZ86_07255 [Oscillatoriales cyanobacterium]